MFAADNQLRTIDHVACPNCGCVCDDLRITVDGDRIIRTDGACLRAEAWFLSQDAANLPDAEVEGRPVSREEAVQRAATMLQHAMSPLIFGLAQTGTDGQREAVRFAEVLGATIDTAASLDHGTTQLAMQIVGACTCTLGEVKNRADLVIFWGADPLESHPRHLERYSGDPRGRWLPGGRADRKVVVVNDRPVMMTPPADLFVPINTGQDFEVLCTLRLLLRGSHPVAEADTSVLPAVLETLLQALWTCRCGVVFYDENLGRGPGGAQAIASLLSLVAELNARVRFYACRLRVASEVSGADKVMTWLTGYPFAVNLARGFPRYNPGEFSATDMLERGDVDACLLVGSQGLEDLSPAALNYLRRIPTILLDGPTVRLPIAPTVRITTSVYGIHETDTAYRMDGVPIRLRPLVSSSYPEVAEIIRLIRQQLVSG